MIKYYHLLILFFACFLMGGCTNRDRQDDHAYLDHVGDTVFDETIDDIDFMVCHDDLVLQYYNFSAAIQYEGEKYAIEMAFREHYSLDKVIGENGFISLRFVVNCEGATGWFRVEEVDMEYEYKQFDKRIVAKLLEITKSLDGWTVGEIRGQTYDYYQYLTFKIEDGRITGITP